MLENEIAQQGWRWLGTKLPQLPSSATLPEPLLANAREEVWGLYERLTACDQFSCLPRALGRRALWDARGAELEDSLNPGCVWPGFAGRMTAEGSALAPGVSWTTEEGCGGQSSGCLQ